MTALERSCGVGAPRAPRPFGHPRVVKRMVTGADEGASVAHATGMDSTDEVAVQDDTGRRWPRARRGVVTVDLDRDGATVTTPGGERRRVSMAEHREAVVRRLLQRGLSPRLLRALLPEFRTLIDELTTN